ncbi:MAG: ACP S-malonyltransferase [Actinomycetota bacterium]
MRAAAVFPGQGSQHVGMADPWAADPIGSTALAEASEALGRDIVEGARDEAALATTAFAQPALLACEVAAYRVLAAAGLRPVAAAGHSLGEFSALVAADALPLADAVRVVAARGEAMQAAGEARPGAMSALLGVGASPAAELCDAARGDDVLVVANENSPQQVVVSGSIAAIERVEGLAAERRVRAVRLQVAGAFHSPLMEPAVAPLRAAIAAASLRAPAFPVASNVTGELVGDPDEIRDLLGRHVVSPVRWERCVAALAAAGADTFLEAGPGDVLTKLAKRLAPDARAVAVGDPAAARAALAG